jgi:hypothetical protein
VPFHYSAYLLTRLTLASDQALIAGQAVTPKMARRIVQSAGESPIEIMI